MRITISVLLIATLTTSGCARVAESRFNPLNWFGGAESSANVDSTANIRPLVPDNGLNIVVDDRVLVTSITSLRINRTPDGAVIQATGQTSGQGFYNAELVPVASDSGTLTFAFRAAAPTSVRQGTQTITAAYVLTNSEVAPVRRVQVQGQTNSMASSR